MIWNSSILFVEPLEWRRGHHTCDAYSLDGVLISRGIGRRLWGNRAGYHGRGKSFVAFVCLYNHGLEELGGALMHIVGAIRAIASGIV